MREIRTKIEIAAPPALVWEVLTDFPRYPEWNPFIILISGEPAVNATLVQQVRLADGKIMTFHPRVIACRENKELRWVGTFILAALFAGEHFWELEPQGGGARTLLIHGEVFTGLAVDYFGQVDLATLEPQFIKMNEALKAEAETLARRRPEDVPAEVPLGSRGGLGSVLR